MKQFVNPFDYAGHTCQAMPKGILLTTKANGKVNTMAIGWGTMGVQWKKPIFIVFVRQSRHTKSLLDKNPVFVQLLGMCSTLAISTSLFNGLGMGIAVTFVMLCATAATYPIYHYVLVPNDLSYLQTIVFILVIAALVQFVEMFLKSIILGGVYGLIYDLFRIPVRKRG